MSNVIAFGRPSARTETWWSERFMAALQSIGMGERLWRGRLYFIAGYVNELLVTPGTVQAWVRGTQPQPYRVVIAIDPLSDDQWTRVERTLSQRAHYLATLLNGQMPSDIEAVFAEAGVSLFPHRNEMQSMCRCPDETNPCKHIAATLFALAEVFDADPFQALRWRGRDREEVLEDLRSLRLEAASSAETEPERDDGWPRFDLSEPNSQDFWRAGASLDSVAPRLRSSPVPDILLRQLPEPPIDAGTRSLVDALVPIYQQVVAALGRGGSQ
jgi:uncharacterized Zn finger protein